jgi:phosphatidylinositol glycan class K
MRSTPGVRSDLFPRPLDKTLLTDFFGGVSQAEVVGKEATESHTVSHPNAGEQKPKAMKPSAVRADTLWENSRKVDNVPGATIRAWAGAGLIGLLVAWISSRST